MTNSFPLATAVVLNYRTPVDTWGCVEALKAQTISDRLEILIVDNHSEDDSVGYLRNRARFSGTGAILENPVNAGYGKGNNLGLSHAHGEFTLIINPDTRLEPAGLERMIAMINKDPSIGILAPRLVFDDGIVRESARTFPGVSDLIVKRTALRRLFPSRMKRYLQHDRGNEPQDVDWVAGACLLARTSLLKDLGGFDPRFFLFFEDTDLCRRTWQAGKRVVYLPSVTASDSRHRLSDGGLFSFFTRKTVRIHLWSAVLYFWKWRGEG